MPTYDYRCTACGHTLEIFQAITAKPLKTCPACKKRRLTRLIGAGAGILFKGSGFYETDYRSESYKEQARKEQSTATGQGSKDSDSKTAKGTKPPENKAKKAETVKKDKMKAAG